MKILMHPWTVLIASQLLLVTSASSATLTAVPMQGGMVMPMIAYRADLGRLRVMTPGEVPQLTPLLVSHPGDRFDPADPWFDALDPSRQGLSFSRRYGFVMDTETDPLPEGTGIWLRRLSASPELGFHRYSASEPKAWEAIFGTAGSPAARAWNGMMFHPAITAPPATEALSATFEAYLADAATGAELAGTGTGPFEFRFTNVTDGRPELTIGWRVVVSWPESAAGWVLETSGTVPSADWTAVTHGVVMLEGRPSVVLDAGAAAAFYRLRPSP